MMECFHNLWAGIGSIVPLIVIEQNILDTYISTYPSPVFLFGVIVYIYVFEKNIRYLRWNTCAWRSFYNAYQVFLALCIRRIKHLCDSCRFIEVNPYFTAPGCRYHFKINSCWPIVTLYIHAPTASNCDVTMTECYHVVFMDAFLSQWHVTS